MKINLHITKVLFLVNILAILLIVLFFGKSYLYAFEIGFFSSMLVIIASFLAYKRMVMTRVEHNIITLDDSKDIIDKLEDPYDLYSEEKSENSEKDLVEVVKEEQQKLKSSKPSLFEILSDSKASLSLYRLGAYSVLILGFLYLNRQGLLHIPTYIIALGLPPFMIAFLLVRTKEKEKKDIL
jgi:ABC-type transport system involved in cytochrome bd biosynthesis fused ATPase/permease subunit